MKKCLGWLLILSGLVALILIQVNNIDLTEMRLALTYWKEYIVIFLIMIAGFYIKG